MSSLSPCLGHCGGMRKLIFNAGNSKMALDRTKYSGFITEEMHSAPVYTDCEIRYLSGPDQEQTSTDRANALWYSTIKCWEHRHLITEQVIEPMKKSKYLGMVIDIDKQLNACLNYVADHIEHFEKYFEK